MSATSKSSEDIGNGGPAFPTRNTDMFFHGMSLRDYFAANVIGSISRDSLGGIWAGDVARGLAQQSYLIADAMLNERGK